MRSFYLKTPGLKILLPGPFTALYPRSPPAFGVLPLSVYIIALRSPKINKNYPKDGPRVTISPCTK